MSIAPRIGVLSLILMLSALTPTAAASGCIDVEYWSFGEGLHVIADTGREIALGVTSSSPGDGIAAVLIITPALCSGVGVGLDWNDVPTLVPDVADTVEPALGSTLFPLLP